MHRLIRASLSACSLLALIAISPGALAEGFGTGRLKPGEIVITEFFEDLYRIDPTSGAVTNVPGSGLRIVDPIAIDAQGQIVTLGEGGLIRYNPANGQRTSISSGPFSRVIDLAIEPDGSILLIDDDNVVRIDPITGAVSTLLDGDLVNRGFFSPSSLAVSSTGRIYVTEFFEDLYEINPVTGTATEVPIQNNALDPDRDLFAVLPGGDLIVEDGGALLRLDPDTGFFQTFASSLPSAPRDLAAEADGSVLVAWSDGVTRYAPGGVQTLVEITPFFSPHAIAVAPAPEPGSLALLAGAGLMLFRRRQN